MKILFICVVIVWIYILTVLHRAKLTFFKFLFGSVGIFVIMMIALQPHLTRPLQEAVATTTGYVGDLTNIFKAYPQYSLIFVESHNSTISMYIDYECSGVIEMMAFWSLLWFFPVYNGIEKFIVTIMGTLWIFASNVIRLLFIATLIHFAGNNIYFFAHAVLGRIIFYILTIILYFVVFTKAQIIRQKVGKFSYGNND